MKIRTVEKEKAFIPEFAGNKDLPAEEQVTVEFSGFPTSVEVDSYRQFSFDSSGKTSVSYSDTTLLARYVKNIKNFEVNGRPVINGKQLVGCGNSRMVRDLIGEIRDYALDDEDMTEGES